MPSAITGTPVLSASPTGYPGTNTNLAPAIQVIWSKEILFQSMPVLRFEQFAVKKTELGIQPGLQINFMRYNNLGDATQLVEGVRMQTAALTASQYAITVAEQGYAVAVSELLLNSSFDDVMASSSRLLGRNMAKYLDGAARDTIYAASSAIFGYVLPAPAATRTPLSPYDAGAVAANYAALAGTAFMSVTVTKDAVETLATKNVPRLGETYVCFLDPHQSRRLRDNPEFIEVTKYAAAGNFMLGEIGRLNDTVYIETTQIRQYAPTFGPATGANPTGSGYGNAGVVHGAIYLGDNAFGHAIALPVELRDGGVLDFGREHALAWYAIWGFGLITDQAVVIAWTN
jgi:N4-gp56 family major capsid protein